jgi:very-short-patch-repair endonuclease
MLMQLHDKQVISSQTLLEEMGLNYDQEVKRMRYEQAQLGPAGAQLGGQQGAMPGMGLGGGGAPGGAASPEQGMGGGMGEGGMPGMGMGPAGGGMDMGMGGGMAGGAAAAGAGGKITKKGKGDKKQEEEELIPMMPIKLTKIEQQMAGMLEELANTVGFSPGEIRMQFPVENPKGGKSFSMDFAIPSLKIDIEADGEVWHSSQEQTGDDTERDYLLAQRGWTILRFDDKSIEDSPQQVQATIDSYIRKAMKSGTKHASTNGNGLCVANYFIGHGGHLKDFQSDGTKYYKYLKRAYSTRNSTHTGEEFR